MKVSLLNPQRPHQHLAQNKTLTHSCGIKEHVKEHLKEITQTRSDLKKKRKKTKQKSHLSPHCYALGRHNILPSWLAYLNQNWGLCLRPAFTAGGHGIAISSSAIAMTRQLSISIPCISDISSRRSTEKSKTCIT